MQPQGRGLDPGHLPVQVSVSGYPMSDQCTKAPISQRWRTNAPYVNNNVGLLEMRQPQLVMSTLFGSL